LSPRVALDVEGVAVLGEAVDEGSNAGGSWEDGTPGLEGEIGRDDGAGPFVTAADDAVEEVPGTSVARKISEFVEDQEVGRGVPFHPPFDGGKGLLLEEVGEGRVDGGEADGLSVFEGALAEILGEGAFADAARSAKEDVVSTFREAEREKLFVVRTVNRTREAPIEAIEGFHRAERGPLGPRRKVPGVAFAAFEKNDLFDHLCRRQSTLGRMSEQGEKGLPRCTQADAAEPVGDVGGHGVLRGRSYCPRS